MINFHHSDKFSSQWWTFFSYKHSSQLQCYIFHLINIYHLMEFCYKNLTLWWKYITVMKIYHCDENLFLWWKYIAVMKIYLCDESLLLQWKFLAVINFIAVMKIYRCDKNLSPWWKFINLMKIYHCNENLSLSWKFIVVMKIYCKQKTQNCIKGKLNTFFDDRLPLSYYNLCGKTRPCALWWVHS